MATARYIHEYSNFPQQLIQRTNYKNVDDDIAPVINKLNQMRAEGFYNQAARYIKDHPELTPYIMDATTINTIVEEIYNAQIMAKTGQFLYFDDDEPDAPNMEDVWIGGDMD